MTDDAYVEVDTEGKPVGFVGADAVRLFRARTLVGALKLYRKTGIKPTRGVGITRMLAIAGELSGKTYRRTQVDAAIIDVETWIGAMEVALPIVERK